MIMKNSPAFIIIAVLVGLCYPSCKHEPIDGLDTTPIDTTGTPIDTTPVTAIPCSPDSVYFQNEVLPLLISNCTKSGCHNTIDRQEGIILDSYANIMATVDDVTSTDWSKNELIEVLLTTEPDKKMPPAPNQPLSTEQIGRISKWVTQGAPNNQCNEQSGNTCDTTNITYTTFIKPLIQGKCQGCHSGSNPQGGIDLSTYASAKPTATNGKLVSSITRATNWMPKSGQKLDNCTITKVKAWVNAGAPQ
jgi:hypothetical protein